MPSKIIPKVIFIVNIKGGIGKTTICLNVAYWLAGDFCVPHKETNS